MLLILAAVSIATLTGENGILTRAQDAKEQTIIGREKEQVELAYSSASANKLGENVTSGELQEELNKVVGNDKTIVTGGNIFKVTFTDTNNIYTISSNRGVEEYQKAEVTPVYAFLCDTNSDGTGETLVLSSTQMINGYTIIKNYGDNEEYQTDEENAENIYGNIYYYPIWKNEVASITNVIIYNNIVPSMTECWFKGCSKLENIENINNLDTSNITNMGSMFNGCSSLKNLNLNNFDTSSVTNMGSMFNGCSSLTNLDLNNFDTSSVTMMISMFDGCSSLANLNLSNFNTSKLYSLDNIFTNCSSLTNLNLSNFNTVNVSSMNAVFSGCTKLKTIIVGGEWSTNNVLSSREMFRNCTSLVGEKGTIYDSNHTDVTYAHIDEGIENPGYLTASES